MATKSILKRAASQFVGAYQDRSGPLSQLWIFDSMTSVELMDDEIFLHVGELAPEMLPVNENTSVGDVCKFIRNGMDRQTRKGDCPPVALKGTGTGGFEELLMTEAGRLDAQGILTMGRYPVASVMMQGSKFPMQVPSLPDFEGVFPNGRQFIIEAKVCSGAAFEITKAKLKPKQVRHLLSRHRFNVPGYILIHFNAREGKTFYDPPVTVGIQVRPESDGGLEVWEKFGADKKGLYAGSLDRAEACRVGKIMEWHTPKQCRSPRPNLEKFLLGHGR